MAYATLSDSQIDGDSPLIADTLFKLRDNPIAIANGDVGAPRVQAAALDTGVALANIADNSIPAAKMRGPVSGTSYLICRVQEDLNSTTEISYIGTGQHKHYSAERHLGVVCLNAGVITAYLRHRSGGGYASYARVIKNGALVQEWVISSTSITARQVNVSVATGDVVVFQIRADGLGETAYWDRLRIYSNNPDFAVA